MSKSSPSFTCSSCGAAHRKWAGRCDACGAWNSIVEEAPLSSGPKALGAKGLGSRPGVPVKVLAKGEISKPLTVHAHGFSASAREAIEAAGGTCVTVEP